MDIHHTYFSYLDALRAGDRKAALSVAREALNTGLDVRDLYLGVFQPAMHEVGRLWESNQLTVAQEHLATAITQSVMAQIYSHVFAREPIGRTLVATCIGGELHELGIRMVADFFELDGWDVYYLGANVPTGDVLWTIENKRADMLAISVTLSIHVVQARELIQALRASEKGRYTQVMVGGQPFNRAPNLYRMIGADLTAADARGAVQTALEALR